MRILLADDEQPVRSALRLILEQHLGLRVVGEAAKAEELLHLVKTVKPDLILLDWELPSLGIRLLPALHALCPYLKIIVLSGRLEAAASALAAGADAFVSKGDPPERLLSALHALKKR